MNLGSHPRYDKKKKKSARKRGRRKKKKTKTHLKQRENIRSCIIIMFNILIWEIIAKSNSDKDTEVSQLRQPAPRIIS